MSHWTSQLRELGNGSRREIRDLLAKVERRGGWTGRRTTDNHIRLRHESGRQLTVVSTPSDWRGTKNTIARIKRVESTA